MFIASLFRDAARHLRRMSARVREPKPLNHTNVGLR